MSDFVMGIDVGTGSVRVGIFDLQGNAVAMATDEYPTYHPHNGWAEQNPEDWWQAICRATRRAMQEGGVNPSQIKGMSVDATCCTVIATDRDYNPLRPAIMWMDVRASAQAHKISNIDDLALQYCGHGNLSAEWMPCKALWLKECEPETYHSAQRIIESVDWLTYRLTGRETLSLNNVSVRWLYDNSRGGWPVSFYEKAGLADLLDKFPSDVLPMGAVVGPLTSAAALQMGLIPGIVVAEGGADAHTGVIGLNVTRPGRMALITGTSSLHLGLVENELHAKGLLGSFPDAIVDGLHLVECGQISTGAIVSWVKDTFFSEVDKRRYPDSQSIYSVLNEQAATLPVGSEGLIMTDYFQGNRTPHTDADVRGMIYGLSPLHEVKHIYRAALEGIAYGTEQILRVYDSLGHRPKELFICGGATKSKLWMQIHADVSNIVIHVPKETEAPCLGSAILGAVAAGLYSSIQEAAEKMVTYVETVEPNETNHKKYEFYVDKYCDLYKEMKDWMHAVTEHAVKETEER